MRDIPEAQRPHLHRRRSLKSRKQGLSTTATRHVYSPHIPPEDKQRLPMPLSFLNTTILTIMWHTRHIKYTQVLNHT
jgi:hypothetical protein